MQRRAAAQKLLKLMGDNTSCPCHSNVGAASILSNTLGSSTNNLHSSGCSDPSHSHSQSHSHSTHSQAFSSSSVTTDYAFEMAASSVRFGRGVTREVGMDANNLQAKHVAVYTDPILLNLHPAKTVLQSLEDNNVSYSVFSDVRVEPTDSSLKEAIHFAKTNPQIDLFIAVGGGSAMDTAKAANLYSSYPDADFLDFVNAPVGKGIPVPGPVKPLIAVPTTAGTGSETTGVAIFDYEPLKAKTGIGSRVLKPTLGIIDSLNTQSMPTQIATASGFDVLCHALESYTALPFHQRSPMPSDPKFRPAYQGSNPISDVWSLTSLEMIGKYFIRAVENEDDLEARENMTLASTYAGVGFGNAGVHLCHGLSYPISGLNKQLDHVQYYHPDYQKDYPLVPHGISVVSTAPSVFRFTGDSDPERHLKCAQVLGADISPTRMLSDDGNYAGEKLAEVLLQYMDRLKVPLGLTKIGFRESDIEALVEGALPQERVTKLSPNPVHREELTGIFRDAMCY